MKYLSAKKYRTKGSANPTRQRIREMKRHITLTGISKLTGISYQTLADLSHKASRRKKVLYQNAEAIEMLYRAYGRLIDEAKLIRSTVTRDQLYATGSLKRKRVPL